MPLLWCQCPFFLCILPPHTNTRTHFFLDFSLPSFQVLVSPQGPRSNGNPSGKTSLPHLLITCSYCFLYSLCPPHLTVLAQSVLNERSFPLRVEEGIALYRVSIKYCGLWHPCHMAQSLLLPSLLIFHMTVSHYPARTSITSCFLS